MFVVRFCAKCFPNSLVFTFSSVIFGCAQFYCLPLVMTSPLNTTIASVFWALNLASFLMFQWSWFTAGFTDPGRVEDSLKRKGVLKQIKQGDIPFCLQACKICPHCQIPVPARSYHCSMCETCVLRQDHHCGVIGSCVGDRNFKPFILSFFYSGIFGIFVGISGTWSIVATGINVITLIVSIYGFILGCILIGFGSSFAYQSFETFSHTHQKASITWKRGVHLLLETFGPTWKERLLPNYLYETEFAWPDIEWTVGTPLL